MDCLTTVVVGVGSGTVAAMATPWAQWGVDKRRQKRADRAEIISGARELVTRAQKRDRSELLLDPRYLAIRPFLKPEVEKLMREQAVRAVSDPHGTVGNYYLGLIRDEADRLERVWDLR